MESASVNLYFNFLEQHLKKLLLVEDAEAPELVEFLCGYRVACTTQDLWRILLNIISSDDKNEYSPRLPLLLRAWINQRACKHDLSSPRCTKLVWMLCSRLPSEETQQLKLFLLKAKNAIEPQSAVCRPLFQSMEDLKLLKFRSELSAASVKPWKDAPSSSFSASKLAEDISYVHASLLQWLHPNELLSSTRHKPVLNLLAETFNFICRLVVTDIVVADSVILAGSKISFWIKVAKKLNSLCDFNGLMSVVSALNNASIVRLKRGWASISSKNRKVFKWMETLMSPLCNFKRYRELVHQLQGKNQVYIPFISVVLRDVVFINDGNPRCIHGVPNMEKVRLFGQTMKAIFDAIEGCKTFQDQWQENYSTSSAVEALKFTQLPVLCDEDCHQLSLSMEPPASALLLRLDELGSESSGDECSSTDTSPSVSPLGSARSGPERLESPTKSGKSVRQRIRSLSIESRKTKAEKVRSNAGICVSEATYPTSPNSYPKLSPKRDPDRIEPLINLLAPLPRRPPASPSPKRLCRQPRVLFWNESSHQRIPANSLDDINCGRENSEGRISMNGIASQTLSRAAAYDYANLPVRRSISSSEPSCPVPSGYKVFASSQPTCLESMHSPERRACNSCRTSPSPTPKRRKTDGLRISLDLGRAFERDRTSKYFLDSTGIPSAPRRVDRPTHIRQLAIKPLHQWSCKDVRKWFTAQKEVVQMSSPKQQRAMDILSTCQMDGPTLLDLDTEALFDRGYTNSSIQKRVLQLIQDWKEALHQQRDRLHHPSRSWSSEDVLCFLEANPSLRAYAYLFKTSKVDGKMLFDAMDNKNSLSLHSLGVKKQEDKQLLLLLLKGLPTSHGKQMDHTGDGASEISGESREKRSAKFLEHEMKQWNEETVSQWLKSVLNEVEYSSDLSLLLGLWLDGVKLLRLTNESLLAYGIQSKARRRLLQALNDPPFGGRLD